MSHKNPNGCSTPVKNANEVASLSFQNISNITVTEETTSTEFTSATLRINTSNKDVDCRSDTVNLQNYSSSKKNTIFDEDTRLLERSETVDLNIKTQITSKHEDEKKFGHKKNLNDISNIYTESITQNNNFLNSTLKINESLEKSHRPSQDLKPISRSPKKQHPKIYVKKENKSINTSYLATLQDILIPLENHKYFKDLLSEEQDILKLFTSTDIDQNYQYVCLKLLTWKPKWYNIFKFCDKLNINLENEEISKLYEYLEENNVVDTGMYISHW